MKRKTKCSKIKIPKNCCYIVFGKDKYKKSILTEKLTTIRDETMIIDVNKKGKVIGIELLGSPKARKPCQEN